jgi:hypothetical protein
METMLNRLQYLWKFSFYTEPLLLIIDCIVIYKIYYSKKSRPRRLFLIYTVAVLILFIITDFMYITTGPERLWMWEIVNVLFSVIEISVFFLFYRDILNSNMYSQFIYRSKFAIPVIVFCMAGIIFISDRISTFLLTGYFSSALYLLLLIPPLLYFYKLFQENKALDKKTSLLSVWLFTYCIITILPTILEGRLINTEYTLIYQVLIAIHYFVLMILCLFLGWICKSYPENISHDYSDN